ncbi:MAG: hypothetical protein K8E24_015480, partial [Methanobacterium paludis]|nr:hypothetical protein [Methanobacterium paludis]
VIMFSSIPDIRYLFKLNFEDDIIEKYNIKLHTWDSNLIIEKIKPQIERNYPNPFTSTLDELPPVGNKPDVEYFNVPELITIDEIFPKLEKFGKKYTVFFNDLKKSPLFLEGDTENNYEVYKRMFGPNSWINYYNTMMSLRRRDKDLFQEINQILIDIYCIDSTQKNPLFDKILEILNKLIDKKDTFISVVVHGIDVPGTKLLLRKNGFEEYIPDRIDVLKWDKLPLREEELNDNVNHVVISTRPPSLNYKLYFTHKVDKFIFVGSEDDIKTYKKIIENRLTEKISRPINFDSKDENSPKLLINVLKELCSEKDWKESDEILEKIYLEEYKIKIPSFEFSSPTNEKLPHLRHKMIKEGENAVLVINNTGKGMFLPLNKHVFFKVHSNDIFHEIEIKKSELNKIENKEILVDRGGVYTSFKSIFTKFMAENGQKILIKGGMFEWEDFRDLIQDSAEWIKTLKNVLK